MWDEGQGGECGVCLRRNRKYKTRAPARVRSTSAVAPAQFCLLGIHASIAARLRSDPRTGAVCSPAAQCSGGWGVPSRAKGTSISASTLSTACLSPTARRTRC